MNPTPVLTEATASRVTHAAPVRGALCRGTLNAALLLAAVLSSGCRVGIEADEQPPTEAARARAAADLILADLTIDAAEVIDVPERASAAASGIARLCGPSEASAGDTIRLHLTLLDPQVSEVDLMVRPVDATQALRVRRPVSHGEAFIEFVLPARLAQAEGELGFEVAVLSEADTAGLGSRWLTQVPRSSNTLQTGACVFGPVPGAVAALALPAKARLTGPQGGGDGEIDARMVVADGAGSLSVFNTESGQRLLHIPTPGVRAQVLALSAIEDNAILAGGTDGAVRVFNATDGTLQRTVPAHLDTVSGVGLFVASNGRPQIYSASWDGVLNVLDIGSEDASWRVRLDDRINAVAVSPSGRFIGVVTGRLSHGGTVQVFETATRRSIVQKSLEDFGTALTFSADSDRVFVASGRGRIEGYRLPDGRPLGFTFGGGGRDLVSGLVFLPGTTLGGGVVAAASLDGLFTVWNAVNGDQVAQRKQPRAPVTLKLDDAGTTLVTADELGLTTVVDLRAVSR